MCPLPRRYHGPLYGFFLFPRGGFEGSTFVPLAAGLPSGSSAVITFSIPLSSFFFPKYFLKRKKCPAPSILSSIHPSFHPSIHPSIIWRSCCAFFPFFTHLFVVSLILSRVVCVRCILFVVVSVSFVTCCVCVYTPLCRRAFLFSFLFVYFPFMRRRGYFWAVWGAV